MAGERGRHRRVMAPLNEAAKERLWGVAGGDSMRKNDRPASEEIWPELADFEDFFYAGGRDDTFTGDENRRQREMEQLDALIAAVRQDREGCRIVAEAESAWRSVGSDCPTQGDAKSKRRIMRWLRKNGFDAGLCRSRWDETEGLPPVMHEYVDVICAGEERYIIDCNLAFEFEIARPTPHYQALLRLLPEVFVGSTKTLREVVALLCAAAAESMRSREMHLPPWRRGKYVQGKWFGPYRRSTGAGQGSDRRAVAAGEAPVPSSSTSYCGPSLARRPEGLERYRKLAVGLSGVCL